MIGKSSASSLHSLGLKEKETAEEVKEVFFFNFDMHHTKYLHKVKGKFTDGGRNL